MANTTFNKAALVNTVATGAIFNQTTMTRAEVTTRLAELDVFETKASVGPVVALLAELGLVGNKAPSKSDASDIVETIISTIKSEVAAGNDVQIAGLGKFYPHTQPASSGEINGVAYQSAEKQVPKFKAGDQFKAAVAGE